MVVCHLLTRPSAVNSINYFSFANDVVREDRSGDPYLKSKPVALYRKLLAIYGQLDLWAMDACSGGGKYTPVCLAV